MLNTNFCLLYCLLAISSCQSNVVGLNSENNISTETSNVTKPTIDSNKEPVLRINQPNNTPDVKVQGLELLKYKVLCTEENAGGYMLLDKSGKLTQIKFLDYKEPGPYQGAEYSSTYISPNGKYLLKDLYGDGYALYFQNENSYNIKLEDEENEHLNFFQWSPTSNHILFNGRIKDEIKGEYVNSGLYVYDMEKKTLRKLDSSEEFEFLNKIGSEATYSISPNGEYVVAEKRSYKNFKTNRIIRVFNIKSGEKFDLPQKSDLGKRFDVSWSPDSKKLIIASAEKADSYLSLFRIDSKTESEIIRSKNKILGATIDIYDTSENKFVPVWNAGSTKIIWAMENENNHMAYYVHDIDSGNKPTEIALKDGIIFSREFNFNSNDEIILFQDIINTDGKMLYKVKFDKSNKIFEKINYATTYPQDSAEHLAFTAPSVSRFMSFRNISPDRSQLLFIDHVGYVSTLDLVTGKIQSLLQKKPNFKTPGFLSIQFFDWVLYE